MVNSLMLLCPRHQIRNLEVRNQYYESSFGKPDAQKNELLTTYIRTAGNISDLREENVYLREQCFRAMALNAKMMHQGATALSLHDLWEQAQAGRVKPQVRILAACPLVAQCLCRTGLSLLRRRCGLTERRRISRNLSTRSRRLFR
jgi:hypothetical protein